MPKRTVIAFRPTEALAQEIAQRVTQTGKVPSAVVIEMLLGFINLGGDGFSDNPLALRVLELENKMAEVVEVLEQQRLQANYEKRQPETIRDLNRSSPSPLLPPSGSSLFDRYVLPRLTKYCSGGLYVSLDIALLAEVGQDAHQLRQELKTLGFLPTNGKVDGKAKRIWLNRSYRLPEIG